MTKKMNSKLENYKYRFISGVFNGTTCIASSFATYFLFSRGVSDHEIGIIIAVAYISATLIAPFLGRLVDKSARISSKTLIVFLAALQIFVSIILLFNVPTLFASIIYCVLIMNVYLIMPILNAVSFQYGKKKIKIDFGIARGFGSLFFAITTFALGRCTGIWGANVIPIASIILNFVIFILAFRILPNEPLFGLKEIDSSDQVTRITGGAFIKKYPLFFVMLLGITLIMLFHNMSMLYFIRIVENVGCGASEMGIAISIAAVLEIPALFLYTKINKHISTRTLLIFSGFSFFLKGTLFCLAGNIWIVYLAQVLQLTSFGIMAAARVYYTHEVVDKEDEVTGQTFMNWSDTISSVLGSTIGGFLMSFSGGITVVLLVGTIICLIGTIIVCLVVFLGKKNS